MKIIFFWKVSQATWSRNIVGHKPGNFLQIFLGCHHRSWFAPEYCWMLRTSPVAMTQRSQQWTPYRARIAIYRVSVLHLHCSDVAASVLTAYSAITRPKHAKHCTRALEWYSLVKHEPNKLHVDEILLRWRRTQTLNEQKLL